MRMTRGTLLATRKKARKGCSRTEENYTKNIDTHSANHPAYIYIHVGIRIFVHVIFADCFNGKNREQVEMKL